MYRQNPPGQPVPQRLPYVALQHPTMGKIYLRVPSPVRASRLMRHFGDEQQQSLSMLMGLKAGMLDAPSEQRPALLLRVFQDSADGIEMASALLGYSWVDPVWALQSPRPSPDDESAERIASFGRCVYEELYEAGWNLAQVFHASSLIMGHVLDTFKLHEDAQEQADFSQPSMEPTPEPSDGSRSNTSGVASEPSTT